MSTRSNVQQCQQRNRSLAGCATCRIRHVKCDEARPRCNVCSELNLDCQGYHSRLLFIKPGESQFQAYDNGSQFRRPLFTESERLSMTETLQRSFCSSSVGGVLADLEEMSQSLQASQDDDAMMCEGPFSVFRLSLPCGSAATPALPSPESITTSSHSELDIDLEEIMRPNTPGAGFEHNSHDHTPISPETLMTNTPFSSNELIEMVLGDFTKSSQIMDLHNIDALLDSDNMFDNAVQGGVLPSEGRNSGEIIQQQELQQRASSSTLQPMSRIRPYPSSLAPEDAAFLLSHYKNHVIGVLSPLKYHRKTPWYILQLPCAMNILAELTMGIQPNAARGALFYGILSISAFSQNNSEFCDTALWKQAGDTYQQQAHNYLRISLSSETSGVKKAKYKELLMALLSMATMTAFKGTIEHAILYLLDAEKLIRLKGLTKPNKSRKIRLLHHCYAYLRIMFESTAITSTTTLLNRDNAEHQEQATFQPSSAFRMGDRSSDIGQALEKDKDVELGQNDIHLEVPGRWLPTLYPAIYGIPEVFMCLLSQATRLANERAAALGGNASLTAEEFSRYAKGVENQICQWAPSSSIYPEGYDSSVSPELVDSNRRVVNAILHAMHHALIIFFYRRVYDISPFIIQHNVENTIKYLEASSLEYVLNGGYTVAIVWPGFIAACEALNPDLQARFLSWFEVSQKGSGMPTFQQAKSIAQEVWRKRRENRGMNFSWIDVIREQNISILWT